MEKELMVSKGNKRLVIYSLRPLSRLLEKATFKNTKRLTVSSFRVFSRPLKKAKCVLKTLIT